MFRQLIAVLVVALCVGAGTTTAQTPSQNTADTFVWHAELVSADAGSGTFTVKAQMLSDISKEVGRFKPGDRLLLTWSGVDRYAGAVRQIGRYDANQKVSDALTLPVELGSTEVQNNYVTIKFRAPAAAVAAVKALKPGEWVTITTRQRSTGDAQAIVTVEPYVKSSPTTS
jgi:hypothetical protein